VFAIPYGSEYVIVTAAEEVGEVSFWIRGFSEWEDDKQEEQKTRAACDDGVGHDFSLGIWSLRKNRNARRGRLASRLGYRKGRWEEQKRSKGRKANNMCRKGLC
jgi:hypothetical protein